MGGAGPLGETVACPEEYSPEVLHPVPRSLGRSALGLGDGSTPPFSGEDVWSCYEASWLDGSGRPCRRVLELRVRHDTPNIVESKSLKLYLNSLNFKRFASDEDALAAVRRDVHAVVGGKAPPQVALLDEEPPLLEAAMAEGGYGGPAFEPIDGTDAGDLGGLAEGGRYLRVVAGGEGGAAEQTLVTHLLRTLCPVTSQPDWGSLVVHVRCRGGAKLCPASLLRQVVSMRREVGFHENAVERVFLAVRDCVGESQLEWLAVYGRFLRRGGIDINPTRCSEGYPRRVSGAPQARVLGQ
mmetsp:Transcript_7940/g.27903  ORF Transcript_7940/g.27903 Transcript_7940/m.27903 type:complete len:297 (-) Transcript_7940:1754-2644(-)